MVSPGALGAVFLEHCGSVGSCGKWSILTGLRGWKFMLCCWHGRCGSCGWLTSVLQAAKVTAYMPAACQILPKLNTCIHASGPLLLLCSSVVCHVVQTILTGLIYALLLAGMLRMQLAAGMVMTSLATACESRCHVAQEIEGHHLPLQLSGAEAQASVY